MRSLGLALLAAQLVTSQSAPQVIGVDVELVNILCSVREKTGAWAQSLDRKDFEVREDGRVQPITHFAGEADSPLTTSGDT